MASVKCRADDKFGIQAGRARGFTVAPGVPHLVNGAAMSDKGPLCRHSGNEYQAGQRRAAVRRSMVDSIALYAGPIRERSDLCAGGSPIAVPWVRPGDARRPSAFIPRLVLCATVRKALEAVIGHLV